jgi:GNAT superfamily N-acetyltransferase
LTIEDYDALIDLWGDAGLSYRPLGRDTRERIAVEMKRSDTDFIGIFFDGRLVAAGLATYDGRKGWINRVAVHPDYRRKSLAKDIIAACERFLEKCGAEIIAALIEDWNEPSMELFEACDYVHGPDVLYFSKRKSADT